MIIIAVRALSKLNREIAFLGGPCTITTFAKIPNCSSSYNFLFVMLIMWTLSGTFNRICHSFILCCM